MKPSENRLTPGEIAYRRSGTSPETLGWNRHFEVLIGEYETAIEEQDEGLIGTATHEVRKVLGDSVTEECGLRRVAQMAMWRANFHRHQQACER